MGLSGLSGWRVLLPALVALALPSCSAHGGSGTVGGPALDGATGSDDGGAGDVTTDAGGMSVASCLVATPTVTICEEFHGLSGDTVQSTCNQTAQMADGGAAATYTNAPCSHAGALGGCALTANGVALTTWYYGAGNLTSALMSACGSAGGTWQTP